MDSTVQRHRWTRQLTDLQMDRTVQRHRQRAQSTDLVLTINPTQRDGQHSPETQMDKTAHRFTDGQDSPETQTTAQSTDLVLINLHLVLHGALQIAILHCTDSKLAMQSHNSL